MISNLNELNLEIEETPIPLSTRREFKSGAMTDRPTRSKFKLDLDNNAATKRTRRNTKDELIINEEVFKIADENLIFNKKLWDRPKSLRRQGNPLF